MNRHTLRLFYLITGSTLALAVLALASCNDSGCPTCSKQPGPLHLEAGSPLDQTGETGAELPEPVVVRARTDAGAGVAGVDVHFEITAGGGSVSLPVAVTDSDGRASVRWTLGAAPVWNRVRAEAAGSTVSFSAWAEPGRQPTLDLLYDLPFSIANEDLAFWPGRGLFLGTDGAILNAAAPGAALTTLTLNGEQIFSPVGIAFGPAGDLYVCENPGALASAVKQITPSGTCTTLSTGIGSQHFGLPNYIAVDGSGDLYVSATCDNMIYRISHVDGGTTEFLSVPGPNGLAFDDEYSHLYFTIENPAYFCGGMDVQGGLFRVPIPTDGTPGDVRPEPLAEAFASVGDGLAFDAEGNLYVVFTLPLVNGRASLTSGVFVYTPDGELNPFFTVDLLGGDIITNIAFGVEPFDPHSLYCYGFTGRLYRVEVGIKGRPLP